MRWTLDEVINPSGVTLACDDIQTYAHKIILKQICTTLKKPYQKKGQKSLQESPTIWTFTWHIGYREQSNLELNHSFFSKDHLALTEARGVPNF